MLRIIVGMIVVLIITSCTPKGEDNLKVQIDKYLTCNTNMDSTCIALLTWGAMLEANGGALEFKKELDKSFKQLKRNKFIILATEYKDLQPLIELDIPDEDGTMLMTSLKLEQEIEDKGKSGKIVDTLIAVSQDEGETWQFVGGNEYSRMVLEAVWPGVTQKLKFWNLSLTMDGQEKQKLDVFE